MLKKAGIGCMVVGLLSVLLAVGLIELGGGAISDERAARVAQQEAAQSAERRAEAREAQERQAARHAAERRATIKVGDTATITGKAMLGVSETDHDRMVQLANARDAMGLAEMQRDGRLLIVEAGTPVRVIDAGLMVHEVRITGGAYTGRSGFVSVEFVGRPAGD